MTAKISKGDEVRGVLGGLGRRLTALPGMEMDGSKVRVVREDGEFGEALRRIKVR